MQHGASFAATVKLREFGMGQAEIDSLFRLFPKVESEFLRGKAMFGDVLQPDLEHEHIMFNLDTPTGKACIMPNWVREWTKGFHTTYLNSDELCYQGQNRFWYPNCGFFVMFVDFRYESRWHYQTESLTGAFCKACDVSVENLYRLMDYMGPPVPSEQENYDEGVQDLCKKACGFEARHRWWQNELGANCLFAVGEPHLHFVVYTPFGKCKVTPAPSSTGNESEKANYTNYAYIPSWNPLDGAYELDCPRLSIRKEVVRGFDESMRYVCMRSDEQMKDTIKRMESIFNAIASYKKEGVAPEERGQVGVQTDTP